MPSYQTLFLALVKWGPWAQLLWRCRPFRALFASAPSVLRADEMMWKKKGTRRRAPSSLHNVFLNTIKPWNEQFWVTELSEWVLSPSLLSAVIPVLTLSSSCPSSSLAASLVVFGTITLSLSKLYVLCIAHTLWGQGCSCFSSPWILTDQSLWGIILGFQIGSVL